MTYVLLYTDNQDAPAMTQSEDLKGLNALLLTLSMCNTINQDSWDNGYFQLMHIQENRLIKVNNWQCITAPQFMLA